MNQKNFPDIFKSYNELADRKIIFAIGHSNVCIVKKNNKSSSWSRKFSKILRTSLRVHRAY